MRRAWILGLACLLALGAPAATRADEGKKDAASPFDELERLERATIALIERVRPCVVAVVVKRSVGLDGREDRLAMSGVVWDAAGHIVSVGGVFDGADAIEVHLPAGELRPATLVGVDEDTGIALLRTDPKGLAPATIGDSGALRTGSIVVAVGNPFGLASSASLGNVSGTHRIVTRGRRGSADVIQTTTSVNPGDPGGVLANVRGQAVGIIASTYDRGFIDLEALEQMAREVARLGGLLGRPGGHDGGGSGAAPGAREVPAATPAARPRFSGNPFGTAGIGFAIPTNAVKPVVERLLAEGKVERPVLGVRVFPIDASLKAKLGLPSERGVVVVDVVEGGPAEKVGLRRYDVILEYGGREVVSTEGLKGWVLESRPGQAVTLKVLREGSTLELSVTLGKRGGEAQRPGAPEKEDSKAKQEGGK